MIDLAPGPAADVDLSGCGPVGPEAVAALVAATGLAESSLLDRLAGSTCYAAWADSRVVSYGWVSRGETPIGEIGGAIRPEPDEAYIWDCATLPAYRRRGWYGRLLAAMLAELGGQGVRRAWIAARDRNVPARRALVRKGFRPAAKLRPAPTHLQP
ncbi:MAG TPA: GNAT family N-acetyltransferase [Chloroflexota bacterium]